MVVTSSAIRPAKSYRGIIWTLAAVVMLSAIVVYYRELSQFTGYLFSRMYVREVQVLGITRSELGPLAELLPSTKDSLVAVYFNRKELESRILRNSSVKSATISGCQPFQLGCVKVVLERRLPKYIFEVAGVNWSVAEDGVILELNSNLTSELAVIRGIQAADSLAIARGQVSAVSQALLELERQTGQECSLVNVLDNGELEVEFRGFDYRVTFSPPNSQDNFLALNKEARRLSRLLSEFRGRESLIKTIDLAFSKMASVRLKTAEEISAPKTSS